MKAILSKLLIGAATLAIASAPLAASAQDWHHNGGGYNHGRVIYRDVHYRRPFYRRYNEGYYGAAPGGWVGYYHNGGWYHHRRQHAGIWIYF